MQFYHAILAFLLFVSLISASESPEHGPILEKSPVSKSDSGQQLKQKSNRQKPPGYHGKEQRKGRKIVELLKTRGNGISKYKDAEPLAEKIYRKQLNHRNEKDRQIRSGERQKGKAPGSGISPSTLPPGYKNKEAILNRAVLRFMRNHPDIDETQAKQMANKEYELKNNEKNRKWREKNRLKRQEDPSKPPVRPRISHGQKTWEAIKQRKIDTLIRQKDKNGVSSREEAETLADQYIQEEKKKNAELKRKKRALKKQEKIEASSANSAS